MLNRLFGACFLCAAAVTAAPAAAGMADIVEVRIEKTGTETFSFSVTVRHADEGWDHYADRWDVVGPDGAVLGERVLHHPHVEEQPFTRSLSGVVIPEDVHEVTIRANDSVHGCCGGTVTVTVPH